MRRLLGAAFVVFSVGVAGAQSSSPAKPNVVLIVADDLGYGDLSSYGAPDIKTPNLDRLAKDGVRLTDYYANAPVCTPTRAALITGRYQQRVGLERPLGTEAANWIEQGLAATGRSFPQLMKSAGYATGLIGKWHLGFKPEYHPNRHGFDYFWGYLAGYIDWYAHVRGDGAPDLWENDRALTLDGYFNDEVTKRSEKFIAEHSRSPFFLEVALGQPHWPFQSPRRASVAPRKNSTMFMQPADPNPGTRADYAAIVEDMDAGIGKILAAIERAGLAKNTIVIFISDNGGEFLSRNAPFFHRKDTVWEGGIRVPAILRWPGVLPAGKVSSQMAITMDLTRTILGLAGAEFANARLEGIDLLPLLKSSAPATDRTFFWRAVYPGRQQRAVRSGPWKAILDGGAQMLFDVTRDPGERHDVAHEHPELFARLKSQIEAWEKDVDAEAAALKTATSRPGQ
jgi:arylsulfatase A-like enzyme